MNLKLEELVKALRCTTTPGGPTGDCKTCPYYRSENLNDELKEKLGTDVWTSYGVDVYKGQFCNKHTSPSMWRDDITALQPDDFCSYGERKDNE